MDQLKEGKFGKWLTAPLRRRKAIKHAEENADKHGKASEGHKEVAKTANSVARSLRNDAKNINYFDPKHSETVQASKEIDATADHEYEIAGKERRREATNATRAARLRGKTRAATPFGGLKEEMNPITAGIKNIQEGNLEKMRQNFNDALSRKAAEALQEKKLEVATNYFGQK
jgi:hypothetical protein